MKETKIVELVIADDSQELAIDAISLVNSPAIEQDFVFFGKEKNNLTFAKVDEEKRMLVSPALIPNKQIFRYDPNTDSEYYVYFSPDTVRKASELYLKHNNHHKATYEHQDRVSGVLTVESWIKEGDNDKSKMFGYDLPNGTWFVKMKIENDELWNKIKEGELKGLSIEGYFANKFEQMNKKEFTTEEIRTALKELLSVQKVDLAKKPDAILKDAIALDNAIAKSSAKIDKSYLAYTKAWQEFDTKIDGYSKKVDTLINESAKVSKALIDLGLRPNDVPDVLEANKRTSKIAQILKDYKNLYPKI